MSGANRATLYVNKGNHTGFFVPTLGGSDRGQLHSTLNQLYDPFIAKKKKIYILGSVTSFAYSSNWLPAYMGTLRIPYPGFGGCLPSPLLGLRPNFP